MELKDLLDEIQEGLPPVQDQPLDLPVNDVPPEDVNIVETERVLSGDQLASLENYKTCLIYRKAIDSREVLDKALALEIFTMLPNLAGPTTSSKLTGAASSHNKSLLTRQLNSYQPSPESMLPLFSQLLVAVSDMRESCSEVFTAAAAATKVIVEEYKRVKDHSVIVFCRKQINLITTPLTELCQIDDRLIDYPPYEGVLTDSVRKIVQSSVYQPAYAHERNPSIEEIISKLMYGCEYIQALQKQSDLTYQKLLGVHDEAFTQIDFAELVAQIEAVRCYKRIYITEPECISAVFSFLKLLK